MVKRQRSVAERLAWIGNRELDRITRQPPDAVRHRAAGAEYCGGCSTSIMCSSVNVPFSAGRTASLCATGLPMTSPFMIQSPSSAAGLRPADGA